MKLLKFIVAGFLVILIIVNMVDFIIGGITILSEIDFSAEPRIQEVKIWENTPVKKLAKAVKYQNKKKIRSIIKENPELLDYQEPRYGATLLIWSVGVEKYESAKVLLECGANPNITMTRAGETALYIAAGYSWVDYSAKKDAKYVKLLLDYGADPNIYYQGGDPKNNSTDIGTSPLMVSIGCGIEKTKVLIDGGADLDYRTPKTYRTAAIEALFWVGPNSTVEAKEYAHYLIVEKKAKVTEPYYITMTVDHPIDVNKKHYPVDRLRYWLPKLDTDEYRMKMEVVDEFLRQGVDYWSTEIPKNIKEIIQVRYPDDWEEYERRY